MSNHTHPYDDDVDVRVRWAALLPFLSMICCLNWLIASPAVRHIVAALSTMGPTLLLVLGAGIILTYLSYLSVLRALQAKYILGPSRSARFTHWLVIIGALWVLELFRLRIQLAYRPIGFQEYRNIGLAEIAPILGSLVFSLTYSSLYSPFSKIQPPWITRLDYLRFQAEFDRFSNLLQTQLREEHTREHLQELAKLLRGFAESLCQELNKNKTWERLQEQQRLCEFINQHVLVILECIKLIQTTARWGDVSLLLEGRWGGVVDEKTLNAKESLLNCWQIFRRRTGHERM